MDKEELIDNLNGDLAGELSAILQYLSHAAGTTGPCRPQETERILTDWPL